MAVVSCMDGLETSCMIRRAVMSISGCKHMGVDVLYQRHATYLHICRYTYMHVHYMRIRLHCAHSFLECTQYRTARIIPQITAVYAPLPRILNEWYSHSTSPSNGKLRSSRPLCANGSAVGSELRQPRAGRTRRIASIPPTAPCELRRRCNTPPAAPVAPRSRPSPLDAPSVCVTPT